MDKKRLRKLKAQRARAFTALIRKGPKELRGCTKVAQALVPILNVSEKTLISRLHSYMLWKRKKLPAKLLPYEMAIAIAKAFSTDPVALYFELTPKEQKRASALTSKEVGTVEGAPHPEQSSAHPRTAKQQSKAARPATEKKAATVNVEVAISPFDTTLKLAGRVEENGKNFEVVLPEIRITITDPRVLLRSFLKT